MEYDKQKHRYQNDVCELTGWVGRCDRHRHDPAKGYTKGNVVILSPNAHRELHELIEAIEAGEDIRFEPTYEGRL